MSFTGPQCCLTNSIADVSAAAASAATPDLRCATKVTDIASNPQSASGVRRVGQTWQEEMRIWCQARLSGVIKALANQLQLHFPRGLMKRSWRKSDAGQRR